MSNSFGEPIAGGQAPRGWDELYADYYLREHQEDAPPELVALFREILEEADASA